MSLENIKCNFANVSISGGGAARVLDLAQVLFAEQVSSTFTDLHLNEGTGVPPPLTIYGDFKDIVAGSGAAGMDNGPLFGFFTNVSGGVFVSNVTVNFDQINRIDAAGAYYFSHFGAVASFSGFTFLESIVDVLGGMGHSLQDVGIFKVNQTGNVVAPPVQAAAATADTGGTVADDTYFLVITALNANGQTVASNEVTIVTTGGDLSTITANWALSVGATGGYNVWIGTTAGAEDSFFHVAAGITTKVITALPGTAGTVPTQNTAATANTQEYINVKNVTRQAPSGTNWSTSFIDGSEVLYVENIMDLVGA